MPNQIPTIFSPKNIKIKISWTSWTFIILFLTTKYIQIGLKNQNQIKYKKILEL